jgi:deoxyribodipyrimidine photo-lyase
MPKDIRHMKNAVPKSRIRPMNDAPINAKGRFVLYWMTASRRVHWNFSLDRAAQWASKLKKPLMILEALRIGYPWASDRFHQFVMAGMADNAAALKHQNVFYYPYLEPVEDADKGLLERLAKDACVVVSDDFPAFFLPRMTRSVAKKIPVSLELVDGNGLLPMGVADRTFTTAYSFRRFLQKNLLPCLSELPSPFVFDRNFP